MIKEALDFHMKLPKINIFHPVGKANDNGKDANSGIRFDPDTQYAVIRSSICTGEKVAGFKNKKDGHFTEVMVIRSSADEKRFMSLYGIDKVRTEY